MMHENNVKVLGHWTMIQLANAYRAYLENFWTTDQWYSTFAPEFDDGYGIEFLKICRKAHTLGF